MIEVRFMSDFCFKVHALAASTFFSALKRFPWRKVGLRLDGESFQRQNDWLIATSEKRPWALLAMYVVTLLVMVKFTQLLMKRQRGKQVVAVQGGWPFLGQVFTMVKGSPWDTMAQWSKEYGGVYSFRLFGNDAICVSDPAVLEGVLQEHYSKFHKDVEWTYKPFMEILGNGLVTTKGKSWAKQRTLLSKYLREDILEQIPQMAHEAVQRLSLKLDPLVKSGGTIEMAEEFRSLTLSVIAEVLLSLDPEESDHTFAKMYLPIMEEGNKRVWNPVRMYNVFLPAWWEHRMHVKSLNDYLTKLITARWDLRAREAAAEEENKNKNKTTKTSGKTTTTRTQDTLDKVLGPITAAEWEKDSEAIVQQIRDEVKTFVLAGHETSASMLAWTLYELHSQTGAKGEENIQKILAESNVVYKGCVDGSGRVVTMPARSVIAGDDVPAANSGSTGSSSSSSSGSGEQPRGLYFTECCLRESLRKYSIVPTVVRSCSEDLRVGPYVFEQGTKIMVNIQGAHHNEENWPEPQVYRPGRFSPEAMKSLKPMTFLPFIAGPRNCLGQFLSLLESKCVLSMLLKRYSFELTNPQTAGRKHPFMVPIIPEVGHYFKVKARTA